MPRLRADLRLLHCGVEFVPALIEAIDAAASSVYLETYIFAIDDAGFMVAEALARAAGRGVPVRVVADWLGTGRTRCAQVAARLKRAGVHFRAFNPWFLRGVARTHRKVCVVDGRVAFVGGININHDLHSAEGPETLPYPRWDFSLRLEGPAVAAVQAEAEAQWLRVGRIPWITRLRIYRESLDRADEAVHPHAGVSFVCCDNLHNRMTIQAAYLDAIHRARRRVLLANPYFAPGLTFRDALATAASRGVEVVLLLGVGQYPLQDAVARSYYAKLLCAGVVLYEYRKTQLHAKVAVIDDDWVTIGSSNCDGLSLFVNQEANVVARDAFLADQLAANIRAGAHEAVHVDPSALKRTPWYWRLHDGTAFLLYRAAMRVITWNTFQ